jgi:hypothetical protein
VIFEARYQGQSAITQGLNAGRVAFATNTLRESTYFKGRLEHPLLFREALGALHSVVVSDFKYHPRDRLAFNAWMEQQDAKFLAGLKAKSSTAKAELEHIEARLGELDHARNERLNPFYRARLQYFNYVYEHEYELNYLFDPVITVHPDEIFFEAFSRDESSYARLGAKRDLFSEVDAFECGTTNIDFSARLAGELDRIRTYRRTEFDIAPSGFAVLSNGKEAHREKKIDVPESWVQGFLQVQSTMALSMASFDMSPIDLFNICRFLRRHKAKASPRAMRFELVPGHRVRVVMEPWEHVIELTNTAIYTGPKAQTIRTWGRDRLSILSRLIPIAQHVRVYLAGFGLPTIYVVDLGPLNFTLALSGWTENDWTGGAAKFDLLTRRVTGTGQDVLSTYQALRKDRFATDSAVASATGLGVEKTRSALSYLCQAGRAMFDLSGGVYRHRDLFFDAFTLKDAMAAVKPALEETTPQAKAAKEIVSADAVRIIARRPLSTGYKLSGSARGNDGAQVRPQIHVDMEGHIIEGSCTCGFFRSHALTKGPCEHLLALRLAHMNRLEAEDASAKATKN